MARPNQDPLIPLPVRLPTSVVDRLRALATVNKCSVSDVLRSHLTIEEAKPLGKPRPRPRREPKLGAVKNADPRLVSGLSKIGNNINQIARRASYFRGASDMKCSEVLIILRSVEWELSQLLKQHAGAGNGTH